MRARARWSRIGRSPRQVEGLIGEVESLEHVDRDRLGGLGPRLRDAAGTRLRAAASGRSRRRSCDAQFQRRHHRRAESHHAAAPQPRDRGAQHHPRLRDRQRSRLPQCSPALADRAGDPDVLPVRRGDRRLAPVRSRRFADARASRPARPAPRWCRRNWCAASITCRPATDGSIACKRSMSAARAFRPPCSSARWRWSGRRSACFTA